MKRFAISGATGVVSGFVIGSYATYTTVGHVIWTVALSAVGVLVGWLLERKNKK